MPLGTRSVGHGARVIIKNALANIAYHAVPMRRFGGSSLARIAILFVGLTAMSADTVPFLRNTASAWLIACLWCCLAYFAIECAMRARTAIRARLARRYFFSPSGLVDIAAVF